MLKGIVVFMRLVLVILGIFKEKDSRVKARKQMALKEVRDGIKANDTSSITAGFAKLKRM